MSQPTIPNLCASTKAAGAAKSAGVAYLLFAVLVATRDVAFDLVARHHVSASAYAAVLSSGVLIIAAWRCRRDIVSGRLSQSLAMPRVAFRVALLGGLAAGIYFVTFSAIARMGAGLFNLVDYGLTPAVTAGLARLAFGERVPLRFLLSLPPYIAGLACIHWQEDRTGLIALGVALLSPLFTSVSDAISKSLLASPKPSLSGDNVLFCRFLVATPVLWVTTVYGAQGHAGNPTTLAPGVLAWAVPAAVLLGYGPLHFLMKGLASGPLYQLALAELAIPTLAFLGTLAAHWDRLARPVALVGTTLMALSIVVALAPTRRTR